MVKLIAPIYSKFIIFFKMLFKKFKYQKPVQGLKNLLIKVFSSRIKFKKDKPPKIL